jgi:hypothetical protein
VSTPSSFPPYHPFSSLTFSLLTSVTNDHGFRDKYYFYRFVQNPYSEMSIMQRYIAQEGFFRFVNTSPEESINRKKQFCFNLRDEIRKYSSLLFSSPSHSLSLSLPLPRTLSHSFTLSFLLSSLLKTFLSFGLQKNEGLSKRRKWIGLSLSFYLKKKAKKCP